MRRVLITGANGFSAQHLIRKLAQETGLECFGTDLQSDTICPKLFPRYERADLTLKSQVDDLISRIRPDWVFHLAGRATGSPWDLFQANTKPVICLLDSIEAQAPNARLLLVGSAAEYGEFDPLRLPLTEKAPCCPISPYGISKYAATRLVRERFLRSGLKVVLVRPFNILGTGIPSSMMLGAVLDQFWSKEKVIRVGNLSSRRDYLDTSDMVEAYLRLIRGDFWGEIFNLCSGKHASGQDIIDEIFRCSNRSCKIEVNPDRMRSLDIPLIYGSNQKLFRAVGKWPMISWRQSIKKIVEAKIQKN